MKHSILMLLVIGASILFFGCSENNFMTPESDSSALDQSDQVASALKSAKPSPKLIGTQIVDFTFTPNTFWNGTVDFGEDYGEWSITYFSHDAPREYSQASPFEEDFIIYKGTAANKDWENPENVLMTGYNAGVVTYANKRPDPVNFHANGKIEEAYGLFEKWQGRNWHVKGVVIWNDPDNGLPKAAIATIRIN